MYSNKQLYTSLSAFADTSTNRDVFVDDIKRFMTEGGWTPRAAEAYIDIETGSGPAVLASVFLNCGTGNQGAWRVKVGSNDEWYIIDQFVAGPQMSCLGSRFIEAGPDGDSIFGAVLTILAMFGLSYEITGTRKARVFIGGTVTSTTGAGGYVQFGTNVLTTGTGDLTAGGWVLRCKPSKLSVYKSGTVVEYGDDNFIEMLIANGEPFNKASLFVKVCACKEFKRWPWDTTQVPATGTYDNSDANNFRTSISTIKITTPTTAFVNPHQFIYNAEATATADRGYIFISALNLIDLRTADTQDLTITECTFYACDTGSGCNGLFNTGYMSSIGRAALNGGASFNKVRYDLSFGNAVQAGAPQIINYTSGRSTGNIQRGIPWMGDPSNYAASADMWIGWSWTGFGAGNVPMYPAMIWDAFPLYEATNDPSSIVNGSSANLPLFFADGFYWKRYTKRAPSDVRPFTMCLKVDETWSP